MLTQLSQPGVRRHCLNVVRPALLLAPANYLGEVHGRLAEAGVVAAVAARDTAVLFDWIVGLLARQGISNRAAEVYAARQGSPTFAGIERHMARDALCPRLRGYWTYADCGYRRAIQTCGSPHHRVGCPVPALPARKGTLAQAAAGLWLFLRDICDGDLVGWIDGRLAAADPGHGAPGRAHTMRSSVLGPLLNVPSTGPKTWSMILAELLLGADPGRERWVTAGAGFVAVDTLVHAFLHRTGILRRLGAEHPYGPACTSPGGCADVVAALAEHIDARRFNPTYPRCFPRWLQFAIWAFCSEGGWSICNGRRIDDRHRCRWQFCPAYRCCDRVALHHAR